jgi:hypothetical protein
MANGHAGLVPRMVTNKKRNKYTLNISYEKTFTFGADAVDDSRMR